MGRQPWSSGSSSSSSFLYARSPSTDVPPSGGGRYWTGYPDCSRRNLLVCSGTYHRRVGGQPTAKCFLQKVIALIADFVDMIRA